MRQSRRQSLRPRASRRQRSAARRPRKMPWPVRLLTGFFRLIWRAVWGVGWRLGAMGAIVLGLVTFYFYAQLPPLESLIDARTKGSVTMLDRDGQVFAWRGETFGGQITADTVSPHLKNAIVATEDKRFYRHFGISPRGIASAIRINLARRARAAGGQRRLDHHPAGGEADLPRRALRSGTVEERGGLRGRLPRLVEMAQAEGSAILLRDGGEIRQGQCPDPLSQPRLSRRRGARASRPPRSATSANRRTR